MLCRGSRCCVLLPDSTLLNTYLAHVSFLFIHFLLRSYEIEMKIEFLHLLNKYSCTEKVLKKTCECLNYVECLQTTNSYVNQY